MANSCPICGKSTGGILGISRPDKRTLEKYKEEGVQIEDGICQSCFEKKIIQLEAKAQEESKKREIARQEEKEAEVKRLQKIKQLPLSAESLPPDADDLGFVSGYCFMGTGPLASFFSSWTDFFGSESNSYLEKVKMAEGFALDRLRMEAHTKGADAIYNVKVNVTEASSGHGMLMFTAYGSAAKRHLPEE